MKILHVGPDLIIDKVISVGKEYFPALENNVIKYSTHTDVLEILDNYPGKVDAVLFAGKTPCMYYEQFGKYRQNHLGLMDYVPRHKTTLYKALLEMTYLKKCELSKISIDTYDKDMLRNLFRDFNIAFNEEKFYFAEERLLDKDYISYVLDFHKKNIREGKALSCLSGLSEVHRALLDEGITSVLAVPEEDVIRQSIRNIQLRVVANSCSENQIVVIAIKIQQPSGRSPLSEDEYSFLSRRVQVLDKLYHFSTRVSGVVVERGNEFIIFTTKKRIEQESEHYHKLSLCSSLREIDLIDSYIGIGYGKTANDSKRNAFEGLKMARNYASGSAFVVFENSEFFGPIDSGKQEEKKETLDERLYTISKESGISINTVHKILKIVLDAETPEFTSKELAILTNTSIRSMDRIILRLVDAGYCEVVSEKLISQFGRPSRILRFHTDKVIKM